MPNRDQLPQDALAGYYYDSIRQHQNKQIEQIEKCKKLKRKMKKLSKKNKYAD